MRSFHGAYGNVTILKRTLIDGNKMPLKRLNEPWCRWHGRWTAYHLGRNISCINQSLNSYFELTRLWVKRGENNPYQWGWLIFRFSVFKAHWGILLKCRISSYRSGVWSEILYFSKFPGDADAVSPGTNLGVGRN